MNGRRQDIGSDWDGDWTAEPPAQESWLPSGPIFGSLSAYERESISGLFLSLLSSLSHT